MIRSILVPLDGSDFAEHALPLAAALARRADATLHLAEVHHRTPPATVDSPAALDVMDLHARQDEQVYLADVVRRLGNGDVPPPRTKTALLFAGGDVCVALKDYAGRESVDLVVMATHARGTF